MYWGDLPLKALKLDGDDFDDLPDECSNKSDCWCKKCFRVYEKKKIKLGD